MQLLPSYIVKEPAYWQGCRSNAPAQPLMAGPNDPTNSPPFSWFAWSMPVSDQGQEPSCVGRAWAAWMRLMMVRAGVDWPSYMHIDGRAIWIKARNRFYDGDLNGGITLEEGFEACKRLGLFPVGSELVKLDYSWNSIARQLHNTPIVTGNRIHYGWFRPDPDTGCIDHSIDPTFNSGGHATCISGALIHNESEYVSLEGSWGPQWPYCGHHLMTHWEYWEGLMGNPYTASVPLDWIEKSTWKDHLIKIAWRDNGEPIAEPAPNAGEAFA